ncbi:hypothetical protein [Belnapia moabensis]|uniref:hypothetical protein n=1 Tax=Belnapia moabensis TaxID=365533 RepID=UPI0012EE3361|nr:hypothetical protein [Belnapia moabensis]
MDELEKIGFGDAAFSRLHHFHAKKRAESIGSFQACFLKRVSLRPGSNMRIADRLRYVFDEYCRSGSPPGDGTQLEALADKAFQLVSIPPAS